MNYKLQIALWVFCLGFPLFMPTLSAQDLKKPLDYMEYIGKEHHKTMEDFMQYSSAVAHSKSARKMENRRKELIGTVASAINRIKAMPAFEGDKAYRDSSLAFFRLYNSILNEDYENIVNLEEISEESYDAMEAYWEAQDQAHAKLEKASDRLDVMQERFAEANNINLIHGSSELSKKLQEAGKVSIYKRRFYLIFFKAFKQEAYILAAIQDKDMSGMEQNTNSLAAIATESLAKIDTIPTFKGDKSLKDACKQYLIYAKDACKAKYPEMTVYYVKQEEVEKTKAAFNEIPKAKRTKDDIDNYNKTINDFNTAVNSYNTLNNALNNSRSKAVAEWNRASQDFLNKHVPKY